MAEGGPVCQICLVGGKQLFRLYDRDSSSTDAADSWRLHPCKDAVFCEACIVTWQETANTCPYCRKTIMGWSNDGKEVYQPAAPPSAPDGAWEETKFGWRRVPHWSPGWSRGTRDAALPMWMQ